jgi:Sec-independent protein translocase protein TatA
MFDFSLAELGVVGVVALLVLGPEEFCELMKAVKVIVQKAKSLYRQYFEEITDSVSNDNVVEMIIDMDGNLQKRYDQTKIMPYVKQKSNVKE